MISYSSPHLARKAPRSCVRFAPVNPPNPVIGNSLPPNLEVGNSPTHFLTSFGIAGLTESSVSKKPWPCSTVLGLTILLEKGGEIGKANDGDREVVEVVVVDVLENVFFQPH